MSVEKFEQAFKVSAPAKLLVKNIRGSVKISPGQEDSIHVTATRHTESGDAGHTEVELKQDADGTVCAIARYPGGSIDWIFGRQPCRVDFVIEAPPHCSLTVHGVSNDVEAGGFEGDFIFHTVSGDLRLNNLTGPLDVHAVSGDVSGEAITAALKLDTVSGDVRLGSSSLTSIQANTVSGDLQLDTPLHSGPYEVRSVSGNLSLHLPPETCCLAELHSLSGDIASDLPITSLSRQHGSQFIAVRDGGVKVAVHSVSGDLSLVCDGLPPEGSALPQEDRRKNRQSVLDRLERGELEVEQALTLLK